MTVSIFAGNELLLVDGIEVDAKTGEFHEMTATPTRYAIESGAVAADHIVLEPDKVEVAWIISSRDDAGGSYGNRAATALDNLRAKIKARGLLQVVTRHRLYENMAIVSIRASNESPFSGGLTARIAFEQIGIDLLERVKLPTPATAKRQAKAGRVQPKEPTPAQSASAGASASKASGLRQLMGKF